MPARHVRVGDDDMASRDLHDLHPALQGVARDFVRLARERFGIDVLIYCTYRSPAEQAIEYAKGRTTVGPNATAERPMGRIVTKARPGRSKHNFEIDGRPAAQAFDCVPLQHGKAAWGDSVAYAKLAEIGRELGLSWAGDWPSFKEYPHFEMTA